MAKGTDSEDFALMSESESRSGLKRELAFVLNVQSEVPTSLVKTQSKNGILEYSRKRFKKSGVNVVVNSIAHEGNTAKSFIQEELETSLLEKPSLGQEVKNNNVLNAPIEAKFGNNLACTMTMECQNDPIVYPSTEESKIDVTARRRFTRSALNSKELPIFLDGGNATSEANNVDEKASRELVVCLASSNAIVETTGWFTRSALNSKELPIILDGGNATSEANNVDEKASRELVVCLASSNAIEETTGLHNSPTRKPLKRFTRSTSKLEAEPTLINRNSEVHNVLMEKPLTIFTFSESEHKAPTPTVHSDNKEAHRATQCTNSDLEHETELRLANENNNLHKDLKSGYSKNNGFSREVGTHTPIVTDDSNKLNGASANKSTRRFTRSALKFIAQPVIINGTREVQNALESKVDKVVIDDNGGLQNTSLDKSRGKFIGTALESKVEHMMIDNNTEARDASAVKSPRRFTRSALKCMTEPRAMDENRRLDNTLMETPLKRFTQLALECKKEPQATDENIKIHNTLSEKPLRRFTRSTLNLNDESMAMLTTPTSCGTHAVSENSRNNEPKANSCNRTTDVVSPIRTPPHKKLEMKMSKKIALTKFPTKISELLETGMFEGLSVTYITRTQQKGVLRGTIKDCGILCSCTFCNESKVVTPNEFERHAGSANKNVANYLYLDNGNTFRDVLNACKDAPLDMLEATIQIAIKSSAVKSATCLNCKRLFKARRTLVLCNSCLELKKSQTSPACIARTVTRSKAPATPKKSDGASKCISPRNRSSGKLTRKDLGLHKLVFEEDGLPDGTELAYYVRGQKLLEGYKKGFGIFCFCCNSEISPSQFEAHAGWASRRKPYLHIYTSNGVSLHELSVSLSKGRKFSAKDNDDLCGICADFGDLLLCDGCPRAFHKDCVGQTSVPRGKWYCPYCQNVHKDQSCANNANALAAGRVSGVDPIEQISKRCIRIVKTPETEVGGCTLCRIPGFTKSYFGSRTIILCDQCEKEFHVGCLRDHNMGDLKELPKGNWFCSRDCSRINSALQKCILRGPEGLPNSITKLIKVKQEETNSNLDISWRLLNGKVASPESRSLLSKAVAIFHDRFDPIVDAVTGRDLIPCMVYGRNIRDQEFGGMCCAVLTVNSSVVSAGLIRIFGQELAEIPLVATSSDYQGKGYFQSLFSCIERLLGFLNVKNIVLPAAEEAEAIWTKKFGFQKVSPEQMTKYTADYQMTIFRGTPILQKPVPKCRIIKRPAEDS